MLAAPALALAMFSTAAHAGIIIGNLVPGSHVVHLEVDVPLAPSEAQVIEALSMTTCDETITWNAPIQQPVHVTDWIAIKAPDRDWCTVDIDLGPSDEAVDLTVSGEFLIGDFSVTSGDWDVTFGDADDVLD